MKRFCALLLAALLLAGCAPMHPIADTAPPQTTVPTTQAVETTLPPETTQATEPRQYYVEVVREGEADQIPVEMVRGTVGNYTIAMDPEYFVFHPQQTLDLFSYDSWGMEPGVFYAISDYRDDATAQEFIDSAVAQFGQTYNSWSAEETAIAGYPATVVCFSGYEPEPSYQMHLYLVNCEGNCYLIEAGFVFEMYEGLYAIMRACFDTMTPVE